MEIQNIKGAITQKYVHGAFNETDIEKFNSIFHPDFSIINIQPNGDFFLFTKKMWLDILHKRKSDTHFDYASIALVPKFRMIDVAENKVCVTLDLLLGEKIVYTDFLLLHKINDEWKIVSKIFHSH